MIRPLKLLPLLGVLAATALAVTSCAGEATPEGTWGEDDGPQLVLAPEGSLSGTDGCNRLTGSWTQEADSISFTQVATTMMACVDVDTWLSGLDTGVMDGDVLEIYDIDGQKIGELNRN